MSLEYKDLKKTVERLGFLRGKKVWVCKTCKVLRPVEHFPVNNSEKGFCTTCIRCTEKRAKNWAAKYRQDKRYKTLFEFALAFCYWDNRRNLINKHFGADDVL